ncbi:MAG: hypothetical protein A2X49_01820 [Lentisphaerae bacterium GWF2_52_8]|nr:MAG: hypothetical protein A2X49_01820 [Lentisphaerae bacterium GWF2_52_8]
MDKETLDQQLRFPLYALYYVDDVKDFPKLSERVVVKFTKDYPKEQLENIKTAIHWGVNNPDYNFNSLLPNIPYNNQEILKYFEILDKQFSALEINGNDVKKE